MWRYNDYGNFASGGLTLGNVVMEFLNEKGNRAAAARTEFKAIAFEPAGDADAAVAELNRRGITHAEPNPYKVTTRDGQERVGWVTINLKGFEPAGARIFLCDYKQRENVARGRGTASDKLAATDGGPLGVTSLKEIVVGVKSVRDASRQWGKLLDQPRDATATVFSFGPGPRIRLVQADVEEIQSIVLSVKSMARAKQFLTGRGMLGRVRRDQIWIDPAVVGGLRVSLVEH